MLVSRQFGLRAVVSLRPATGSTLLQRSSRLIPPLASMTSSPSPYWDQASGVLRENTTKKYYIEYHGFLSNHISHGIYALRDLAASPDKLQRFVEFHDQQKLESAEEHRKRELRDDPRPDDVMELLGERKSFYHLYEYYETRLRELYGGSVDRLVRGEFPKIYSGMVGSALHGMIHLGYGFASSEPWFILEGLAYLHHSNVPLVLPKSVPDVSTLGSGSEEILDVLGRVRADTALSDFMWETIKREDIASLLTSPFQRKSRVLLTYKGDDLARYVHAIKFPPGLSAKDLKEQDVPRLAKWLVDCSIIVYAIAVKKNDFFLLHGVTAAWSVYQIMPLLADDLQLVAEVTRAFLCVLVTAYLAQGHPEIQTTLLGSKEILSDPEHSWEKLVSGALEHENYGEEHIYKLVQVCRDMSNQSGGADSPGDLEHIYRLASYNCVHFPLLF